MNSSNQLDDVAKYYSDKIQKHGTTPEGVDWNGEESQFLRFDQIGKIIIEDDFTITDVGCGYGAFYDYLKKKYKTISYSGYDISEEMVRVAKSQFKNEGHSKFYVGNNIDRSTDYCVASGIFNVQLESSDRDWEAYIFQTLDMMNKYSDKGFSFNCLTSYSDSDKIRDYLYYADPCKLFDYCKKNFSKQVALLHDYGLYEFTILVRKDVK